MTTVPYLHTTSSSGSVKCLIVAGELSLKLKYDPSLTGGYMSWIHPTYIHERVHMDINIEEFNEMAAKVNSLENCYCEPCATYAHSYANAILIYHLRNAVLKHLEFDSDDHSPEVFHAVFASKLPDAREQVANAKEDMKKAQKLFSRCQK